MNQIDVRPLQVLIEVLIVEARTDYSFNFGLNASAPDQQARRDSKGTVGGSLTSPVTGLGDLTMKLIGVTGYNVESTIAAAEGRGDVRIISRPVVHRRQQRTRRGGGRQSTSIRAGGEDASDRDRGSGSSRSIQGRRDQAERDADDQRRWLGATGGVAGGEQRDDRDRVQCAGDLEPVGADAIARARRTDGSTGRIARQRTKSHAGGVPLFSSLPFIGGMFGHYSETMNETELYIFITPRVIHSDDEAAKLTDPLRKRADDQRP